MKIEVKSIQLMESEQGPLKAFADITLSEGDIGVRINGLKVIQVGDKPFIQFPNKRKDEAYYDIAHPVNQSTRLWIEGTILEAYDNARETPKS